MIESQYCIPVSPLPLLHVRTIAESKSYLVDHHNRQQIADRRDEQSIHIMLRVVADRRTRDVQDHLAGNEEKDPEADVAQRPPVLQRVADQQHLHDDVHEQEDGVEDVQHDEQTRRVRRSQARPAFEGEQGDGAGDDECGEG